MSEVDCVVIGAGVVGLACAASLARRGMHVIVLEAEAAIGTATSSRNSEVIHAGIYYPAPSLKARLCLEGRRLLYEFCEVHGIPHRRLGKIIFASNASECGALAGCQARGRAAGVDDLRMLSAGELSELEPELDCAAALYSPSTGIVDAHALMLALEGELGACGGQVVCNAQLSEARRSGSSWQLHVTGHEGPALTARRLVNAGGLRATAVAERCEGLDPAFVPQPAWARGCYFSYAKPVPFRHLIYPVPVPGGLGTHLTLDLAGRARFGPDFEWVDEIDYSVDPDRYPEFLAAARKIWADIDPEALHPGYAGIRPKVRAADGIEPDFIISGPDVHGMEGLVNLFGIESPGLTACLAIGEEVANSLGAGS